MAQHSSGKKKKGGGVWRVVFVIALIVFIASIAGICFIGYSYYQGQAKYGDLARDSGVETEEIAEQELEKVNVDWKALIDTNPDTVAWLYIPNTNINYPVVQGLDNDYYLHHDFDGDAGWLATFGTVFMDYRDASDWSDQQYFFYGHHMNDGSMFADLAGFTDQARFDECRVIYLLTPRGNFKLRTYAMLHVSADDTVVQNRFGAADEMVTYVQDKIDLSVVDPGDIPKASEITKSFAFATCDNINTDGRYILYAYVDDTSAKGLEGNLGLESTDGETTGFANELTVEE